MPDARDGCCDERSVSVSKKLLTNAVPCRSSPPWAVSSTVMTVPEASKCHPVLASTLRYLKTVLERQAKESGHVLRSSSAAPKPSKYVLLPLPSAAGVAMLKICSPGGVLKYVLSVCSGRLSWEYAESAVLAPEPCTSLPTVVAHVLRRAQRTGWLWRQNSVRRAFDRLSLLTPFPRLSFAPHVAPRCSLPHLPYSVLRGPVVELYTFGSGSPTWSAGPVNALLRP